MGKKTLHSTQKAKDTVKYIVEYCDDSGYPPTLREIMIGIGLRSTSAIVYRLSVMEELGYLKVTRGVSRGIKVTDKGYRFIDRRRYAGLSSDLDAEFQVDRSI